MKSLSGSVLALFLFSATSWAGPFAPREMLLNDLGTAVKLHVQDKIEIPPTNSLVRPYALYQGGFLKQPTELDWTKPHVRIVMKHAHAGVRYLGPTDQQGAPRVIQGTGFVPTGVPGSIVFLGIPTGLDRTVSHIELVVPGGALLSKGEPAGTVAQFQDAIGYSAQGKPRIEFEPAKEVPLSGDPSIASSSNPKRVEPLEHVAVWAGDGAIQAN